VTTAQPVRQSRASQSDRVPPLVVASAIVGAVITVAALLSFLLGADWYLLKLGEENNIPTWYSSSQLLLVALALSALAVRDTRVKPLRSLALIAAPTLFFILSLDEIAMIHERIGVGLQSAGIGTGLRTTSWMFVFAPFVAVVGLISVWACWPYVRGRSKTLWLLAAGVVLYGASAVGLEFIANFVGEGSLWQKGLGFAEEYGEMLAVTLLLWGCLTILQSQGIRLDLGDRKETTPCVGGS